MKNMEAFEPEYKDTNQEELLEEKKEDYYIVRDFTGRYEKQAKELSKFVDSLPDPVKGIFPPVEILESARDSLTPDEIEKIKEKKPNFNPDESAGEYRDGKLKLYAHLFDGLSKVESEEFRRNRSWEILLHEFGHYIYDCFLRKDPANSQEFDRARKKDKKDIFYEYAGDLSKLDFYDDDKRDEDFSETFHYFLFNPEKFKKDFPNRYNFCKKLVESFSKNKNSE